MFRQNKFFFPVLVFLLIIVLLTAIAFGAVSIAPVDMGARLLLAPAEIPIGIITSLVGAPLFIILLKRFNILQ